ncbi:sensor histidine kinase [Micromonospora sp. CPCC 206061]|uniref:sensor histidine kinase n=1 Tax=Micromonospora sp. CPCC 206061 TaxID=3122410 RepID=UPI002FEED0B0
MPVFPVGGRPVRLATIPIVLCVVIYSAYRITNVVPWGGYDPGFDLAERVLGAGVIVALGAVQILFAFRRPSRSRAGALLAVQALLAFGPYFVFGGIWDPPAAFVIAAVLLTFTGWFSWVFAALVVLGDVAVRVAVDPGLVDADGSGLTVRAAYTAIAATANGLLLFGMSRLSALVRDLHAARTASASLEVARERLRIARRLQDVVGGRLASIIATCRSTGGEASQNRERARAVAAGAREALAQVRTVADDYRDRSLAGEVAAAHTVLTATGVEVIVGSVPDRLPRPVDALLGTILRRVVVDALRGVPPRRCRIELDGSARMCVSFTGGEPGALALDGFAEEVEQLGGRLRVGPGPGTMGGVDVRIPVQPHRSSGARGPRPVSAAPWLAWGIMAVLEVDLLVTTLARASGGWDFYDPLSMPRLACVLALIVPLSLLQLHHVRPRAGNAPPRWRWTLTLQILLVCSIAAIGSPTVPAPEYAGPVGGVVLFHVRRPWAWAVASGLVLGTALVELHRFGVDFLDNPPQALLWTLLSVPWAFLAMVAVAALCRLPVAAEQLVAARRELARLAVLRERLRIARDTHDLLGFQLSAIALKAELGGRLAGTDPDAARIQLAEADQVAEEALNSLRSITAEPTGLSFTEEVESARSMLAAAGTRVAVELRATPGPSVESPLAIVLREAVTNVVRHARATTCEIETSPMPGGIRLRVTNDGVQSGRPDVTAGNGLANLLTRVREAGGRLSIDRQRDRFTLVAEIRTAGAEVRLSSATVAVAV